LARHPIITFSRSTRPYMQLKEMFDRSHLHHVRIFGNSSLSSIVRMTLDGIGIAAIPHHVVTEHLSSGRLRRIDTGHEMPVMPFTASFVRRVDMPLSAIVAGLAQNVAAHYEGR
ncbi:LysR substrate-binding domain-containing protein, partial [Burkholderia cenocepacia]